MSGTSVEESETKSPKAKVAATKQPDYTNQ
jgi:hypothetical protein